MRAKSSKFKHCLSHSPIFQLNISRARSHMLKESLNPHVKKFEMEGSRSFTFRKKKKNASYCASGINLCRLITSNTNHKIGVIYHENGINLCCLFTNGINHKIDAV
jgi:hypothetical protein